MKTSPSHLILSASLLFLPTHPLQAGVDSMLTLSLTCYSQERIATSGDTDNGRVNVMRLNAKQLLGMLANDLNVHFPNGSQLRLADTGKVHVADSNGVVLRDVSPYLHAQFDQAERLFDGSRNRVTGQEKTLSYYPMTFTINLATLKGTVQGIMIEKFTVSAPDQYGVQRIKQEGSSAVNGSGSYGGGTAYFDGSLKLIGQTASISGQ